VVSWRWLNIPVETYRRFSGMCYFHFTLYLIPKRKLWRLHLLPCSWRQHVLAKFMLICHTPRCRVPEDSNLNYAWCFLFSSLRVQIFARRQTDLIKNFRGFRSLSSQMSRVTPRPFHSAYFEFGIHHSTLYNLSYWKRC